MIVAQQLYEGIELSPGEPEGLITYMRTDSTRISKEAAMEALKLVREKFGDEYALQKPRFFKNRKKAQDAHEAIRPTSVFNTPEKIKPFLSKDQFSLYELIWKRFVASQMKQALVNKISISIGAGPYLFSASGSSVAFPGFMTLYMTTDDQIESERQKKKDDFPDDETAKEISKIFLTIDCKIEIHEAKKHKLQEVFSAMLNKLMTGAIRVKDINIVDSDNKELQN